MGDLTAKEEAFAREYVLGGCSDATAAWSMAHPDSKAKPNSRYVAACRMVNDPKVALRIDELKRTASVAAEKAFTITVEQRLRWLDEVAKAGLETYIDNAGNKRRENLAATRAAVQTMNEMLGVDGGDGDSKSQPLEIKFTVSAAKASVETTNVERD